VGVLTEKMAKQRLEHWGALACPSPEIRRE
jgi:hypothetical protein